MPATEAFFLVSSPILRSGLSAEYRAVPDRQKDAAFSLPMPWPDGADERKGGSLGSNFAGEIRKIFRQLDHSLKRPGGRLWRRHDSIHQ
jgi:hypothetical protein